MVDKPKKVSFPETISTLSFCGLLNVFRGTSSILWVFLIICRDFPFLKRYFEKKKVCVPTDTKKF